MQSDVLASLATVRSCQPKHFKVGVVSCVACVSSAAHAAVMLTILPRQQKGRTLRRQNAMRYSRPWSIIPMDANQSR